MSYPSTTFGKVKISCDNSEILVSFLKCHKILHNNFDYDTRFFYNEELIKNEDEIIIDFASVGRHSFEHNCLNYGTWLTELLSLRLQNYYIELKKYLVVLEQQTISLEFYYTDEEEVESFIERGIIRLKIYFGKNQFQSDYKLLSSQLYEHTAKNLRKYCRYDEVYDNSVYSLYQLFTVKNNDIIRNNLPDCPRFTYEMAEDLADKLKKTLC